MKKIITSILTMIIGCNSFAGIIYVKSDASGSEDGTTWINAYRDLQAGITQAVSNDTICVASGIYIPSIADKSISFEMKNAVSVFGGFGGNETINGTTINNRDFDANQTVLSGDLQGDDNGVSNRLDNSYHVVYINTLNNVNCILDGFTISGGNAVGASPDYQGGGIYFDGYNKGGSAYGTYNNLLITDNYAGFGGAVAMVGVDGSGGGSNIISPTFKNCMIMGNVGTQSQGFSSLSNGAGVYCSSSYNSTMAPIFKNVQFLNNVGNAGSSDFGGALYLWSTQPSSALSVNLDSVYFCENDADFGAAIYIRSGSTNTGNISVSLTDATIGGGSYNEPIEAEMDVAGGGLNLAISNTIIWSNSSLELRSYGITNVTIDHSIIDDCGDSGAGWNTNYGTDNGNNFQNDPLFVFISCDPTIANNSPAIGVGVGGENIGYYKGVGLIDLVLTTVTDASYCSENNLVGNFSFTITDTDASTVAFTYSSSDNLIVDPGNFTVTESGAVRNVEYSLGASSGTAQITVSGTNSLNDIASTFFNITNNESPIIDSIASFFIVSDTLYCFKIYSNLGEYGADYYITDEDTSLSWNLCNIGSGDHMAYVESNTCIDSFSFNLEVILPNVPLSIGSILSVDTICYNDSIEIQLNITNEIYDNIIISYYSQIGDSARIEQRNGNEFYLIIFANANVSDNNRIINLSLEDDRGDYASTSVNYYTVLQPTINTLFNTSEAHCYDVSYYFPSSANVLFSIDGGTSWDTKLCEVYNWISYDVIAKITDNGFVCITPIIFTFMFDDQGNVISNINDLKMENALVYPNPTKSIINISGIKMSSCVKVESILGEIIYNEKIYGNKATLDLSAFSKGIYFVNIIDKENKQFVQKVILE